MKFPHLNLLFFIALLAFTSCEKEAIAIPEQEPTEDSTIGMRCCEDAVADMVADPRFLDFYDGFTEGVFDPISNLFDQYDSDEIAADLEAFNTCYLETNNFELCLEKSEILTQLLAIISNYDRAQLNSLKENYGNLETDDLISVILDAVNQTSQESGRKLPCFQQFESDVIDITVTGAALAAETGGVPAAIGIIVGIVVARMKFCRCLYSTYGRGC